MNKTVKTYYKLSHPKMAWDLPERFDTQEDAHQELLKMQVRQKENGYTPDKVVIIRVERETIFDSNGEFVNSIITEKRV